MKERRDKIEFNHEPKFPNEGTVYLFDPDIAQVRLEKFKEDHISATEILMTCRS